MSPAVRLLRDVPLQKRNTFGVAARARLLAEVADPAALPALYARAFAGAAPLVLGGGSNLLFAADPDVPLLALTGREVRVLEDDGERAIVRADAGVEWHGFVMRCLGLGLAGLENLALIPGTVGAAPIQNIGAYGVEVRERIHAVEAFEPATGAVRRLRADECAFAYRDSVFKREPGRYVVVAVEFALARGLPPRLEYAGIGEELAARGVAAPTARDVAEAVIAIRRRKLPDPAVLGNAGSFFKNPIVPRALAEALQAGHPALPVFRGVDAGTRKLSAAWLIDACGWKGHRDGAAGVAASHALVLVNHGGATGMQLLDLARRIADSVQARFGVAIEPEPRIVGARW
ncbi:UDP-N-acetylmuramate dehydrogenase [Vulcaniibacterium tengchongense]|uniref:UDP-N-acetylenolpyruvoylglucosamine reductase n=1 Tax=Vulcaniibacterium tengchongense TaxID=1273429 RepID=A0A3N4V2A1_9GAMM|nr:UDP-N-acetylmuramate dehydrogenase [Vulcaniibacterium tengchongense]RPE77066.1 UDP-N-acetylmuramate dehydrogenase [Vulcaniibacterium tengchongense]